MKPHATLGVLTDTDVLLVSMAEGKKVLSTVPLPPQPERLDALLQYAWRRGLTSVWVLPGTTLMRDLTPSSLEQACRGWQVRVICHPHDATRLIGACVRPREGASRHGLSLTLSFPEHAGWEWALPDATTLLATVTYLEQALGMAVGCSPEQLAAEIRTHLTLDCPASWFRPVDLSILTSSNGSKVPVRQSAQEVQWMRPLTLAEMRQKYLHRYDHLCLYAEAGLGAHLGVGEPVLSANGRAYNGKRPGVWLVNTQIAGSVFDGKRLPSCIHGEWMSTPQVRCCQDIAYQVQVKEGYSWPESHPLLERWASTLWQVVQRFKTQTTTYRHAQARANAARTVRRLAQMGGSQLVQEETSGDWARPDWWAQLVGQARATLFARLVTLVRKGYMPVLVDMDALWLVSNDPNPISAFPGLVTSERMGSYTVGYDVPLVLSREVKEVFRTTQDAGELVKALNALAYDQLYGV